MKPLDLTWRNNVLWLLDSKLSRRSDNFLIPVTVISLRVKAASAINVPSGIMNKNIYMWQIVQHKRIYLVLITFVKTCFFSTAALILVISSWVKKRHGIIIPVTELPSDCICGNIKGFLKTGNITGNALAKLAWLIWNSVFFTKL